MLIAQTYLSVLSAFNYANLNYKNVNIKFQQNIKRTTCSWTPRQLLGFSYKMKKWEKKQAFTFTRLLVDGKNADLKSCDIVKTIIILTWI